MGEESIPGVSRQNGGRHTSRTQGQPGGFRGFREKICVKEDEIGDEDKSESVMGKKL